MPVPSPTRAAGPALSPAVAAVAVLPSPSDQPLPQRPHTTATAAGAAVPLQARNGTAKRRGTYAHATLYEAPVKPQHRVSPFAADPTQLLPHPTHPHPHRTLPQHPHHSSQQRPSQYWSTSAETIAIPGEPPGTAPPAARWSTSRPATSGAVLLSRNSTGFAGAVVEGGGRGRGSDGVGAGRKGKGQASRSVTAARPASSAALSGSGISLSGLP
ncbi:hypothetical protein DFJ73DRAFT_964504 [Zopfochytrium polystomum]|nr:hypothetical protein DFJ73DRAFT_964504 [Zopfochytrium polystomum]